MSHDNPGQYQPSSPAPEAAVAPPRDSREGSEEFLANASISKGSEDLSRVSSGQWVCKVVGKNPGTAFLCLAVLVLLLISLAPVALLSGAKSSAAVASGMRGRGAARSRMSNANSGHTSESSRRSALEAEASEDHAEAHGPDSRLAKCRGSPEAWAEERASLCCGPASSGHLDESAKSWCANHRFDCKEGLWRWKEKWSDKKKTWCCKHKGMFCGFRSPNSTNSTISTNSTTNASVRAGKDAFAPAPSLAAAAKAMAAAANASKDMAAAANASKDMYATSTYTGTTDTATTATSATATSTTRTATTTASSTTRTSITRTSTTATTIARATLPGASSWPGATPAPAAASAVIRVPGTEGKKASLRSGVFDCQAFFSTWEHDWTPPQKKWCCEHAKRGCHPRMSSVAEPLSAAGDPQAGPAQLTSELAGKESRLQAEEASARASTEARHRWLLRAVAGLASTVLLIAGLRACLVRPPVTAGTRPQDRRRREDQRLLCACPVDEAASLLVAPGLELRGPASARSSASPRGRPGPDGHEPASSLD